MNVFRVEMTKTEKYGAVCSLGFTDDGTRDDINWKTHVSEVID